MSHNYAHICRYDDTPFRGRCFGSGDESSAAIFLTFTTQTVHCSLALQPQLLFFFFLMTPSTHAGPPPCFDLFIHACSCEDVSKWICVSIYQDACRSPRACVCVCFPYPPLERLGEWRWRPCVARRAGWGQSSPDAPSDSGHHSLTSPWGGTGRQREQFLGDGPCACVFMSLVAVCLCVRSCVYVCVYVSECEAEISLQYVPCQHW